MTTTSHLLAQGWQHQRSGDAAGAAQAARQVLQAYSGNIEALHLLRSALQRLGQVADCLDPYQKAVQIHPARPELHNDLGILYAMQGRHEEAIAAFQRVLELKPSDVEVHNNLGNVLRLQGKLPQAIAQFTEALRINPKFADALHNLGLAQLEQGRSGEAIASLGRAAYLNQHNVAALEALEKAVKLNPNSPDAHNSLGNALARAKRAEEAIAEYREALRLRPEFAEAFSNLTIALTKVGRLDEAAASCREALRIRSNYAPAHNNLANVLVMQGRVSQALASMRRALEIKPDNPEFNSTLLGTLHYEPQFDHPAMAQEHQRWEKTHALPLLPPKRFFANERSPNRRLRIGYLSPDFRDHAVGRNIWPLISRHDREQFDITLYANLPNADAMTERFHQSADHWCSIAGWPDDRVVEKTLEDKIDILVDLALHTTGNRLLIFARKPAPIQVTFAGYPGTTGLHAIDYRLTDPYLDPPGPQPGTGLFDAYYAEKSHRLPHSFWCFDPQTEEPAVSPLPALKNGFITFGSLNNFCKVNDVVLELWAKILVAVKASRLILLAKPGSHQQRTIDSLAARGVAAERVQFVSPKPRPEYLACYHQIDIGLDTLPYNGHTTSLDSFWMGVPVLTLIGKTVVGRAGLSQLSNLGLPELAASTPEKFIAIAVQLANDLPRLTALRAGLRPRMKASPLMDFTGFARAIEEAYRTMWRDWLNSRQ